MRDPPATLANRRAGMPPKRTLASPSASGGTSDGGGGGGGNTADGLSSLPKLPMVRHGKQWLRCKTLRTTSAKVQLECCGFEGDKPAFWLPLSSDRLWRGSYKGKDWRHLVRAHPEETPLRLPPHRLFAKAVYFVPSDSTVGSHASFCILRRSRV